LDAEDSGLIVIGFDKGEGLTILFAASVDEARGGIFTSFGTSFLSEVWSAKELEVGESGAGLAVAVAMFDRLASRLVAEFGREG